MCMNLRRTRLRLTQPVGTWYHGRIQPPFSVLLSVPPAECWHAFANLPIGPICQLAPSSHPRAFFSTCLAFTHLCPGGGPQTLQPLGHGIWFGKLSSAGLHNEGSDAECGTWYFTTGTAAQLAVATVAIWELGGLAMTQLASCVDA